MPAVRVNQRHPQTRKSTSTCSETPRKGTPMTNYTPSLEEVRDATSLFRSRFFDHEEFDRWHAAEIAAAEQRGAARELRHVASMIKLGNEYYEMLVEDELNDR